MGKIVVVGRIKYCMILMILLFSCQDSDRKMATFTFKEDKKIIDFSTEILTPIVSSFSIHSENQEDYHLYIDPHNTLVVIHLQSMQLFKNIPIQIGDGPDLVHRIPTSAIAIDLSSFLVNSYPNFYIINDEGFVKKELYLNKLLREEMKKNSIDKETLENVILSGIGFPMNRSGKGEFIFTIRRLDPKIGGDIPLFPQFAQISIGKDFDVKLEILPVYIPEDFHFGKGLSFVDDETPTAMVDGDWLIYNYYFSSNVYLYNLKSGERKSLSLKITTGENFSPPYGERNISTGFANILYDDRKKTIYRNHIVLDHENPMEGVNYLAAYSFEGDLLSEYKIGSNSERLLRNTFIFEENLYMNPFYPKSDEKLELIEFQLVENE